MLKLHFGCGGVHLDGWFNFDVEVDVTKPLPFGNEYADRIFCEHLIEHLSSGEAWRFLNECYRILRKGGRIRIAVPSPVRIAQLADDDYVRDHGGTIKDAVMQICCWHGHETLWTYELLECVLKTIGFKTKRAEVGRSDDKEFVGIEGHGKQIGEKANMIETIVVEGEKI